MELTQLEDAFVDIGGHFITSAFDLREKLPDIKAVFFDWDGVFNSGHLDTTSASGYSLIDAQGVESMRFGFFRSQQRMLITGVVSEVNNMGCKKWADAFHIHNVYLNGGDKQKVFNKFCEAHSLSPSEVIFVYDDVQDLSTAAQSGISLAIGRLGSPLFLEYVEHHRLADYISSCQGNEHAVREVSELILSLLGQQFEVLDHQEKLKTDKADYQARRNSIKTELTIL